MTKYKVEEGKLVKVEEAEKINVDDFFNEFKGKEITMFNLVDVDSETFLDKTTFANKVGDIFIFGDGTKTHRVKLNKIKSITKQSDKKYLIETRKAYLTLTFK